MLSDVYVKDIIAYNKTCAVCIGYYSRWNIPYYNFLASLSICLQEALKGIKRQTMSFNIINKQHLM